MERALADAENFRQQVRKSEYEAKMFVQEWDGRGRLRGTAKATAIMRPGDKRPMTFVSREVQGKVRLPSEKDDAREEEDDKTTLQDFAREHRISERFDFVWKAGNRSPARRAVRIRFAPNQGVPGEKHGGPVSGYHYGDGLGERGEEPAGEIRNEAAAALSTFWILAVLKECTIEYELIEPGEILGHAKLKVLFAVTTPIYSIRQQHDVDLDKFRPRNALVAAAR